MIKKYLKEYRSIVKEIEEAEYQIKQDYEHGRVSGSDSQFPYTKRTFKVEGLKENPKNDTRLYHLNSLKNQKKKVDRFISKIPDRITKRIFILKYIEGDTKHSWNEIADNIGGGNTAEGIRKRVYRYLKNRTYKNVK